VIETIIDDELESVLAAKRRPVSKRAAGIAMAPMSGR